MRRDDGMTLIELTVGMVLLSVFMVMFTGAILMINKAMNTSQAVNDAASQTNTAFLRLDEVVRPASYISTPGRSTTSQNWYVELRYTYTGTETCTQLRVERTSQQLQSRSWTVVNAVASPPSTWSPLASNITNGNAAAGISQPFALAATTGTGNSSKLFQQLSVTLAPPPGPGISTGALEPSFTVTALNSVLPAPTTAICQQQGRP